MLQYWLQDTDPLFPDTDVTVSAGLLQKHVKSFPYTVAAVTGMAPSYPEIAEEYPAMLQYWLQDTDPLFLDTDVTVPEFSHVHVNPSTKPYTA
jgi:hypothetical protein